MYLAIVLGTMLILPLASLGVAYVASGGSLELLQGLEVWFVFWALGVRLFVAGLRQVFQPSFTAQHIFEIDDAKAHVVVQELGFANITFGTLGLATMAIPSWLFPACLAGTLFYGLAGVNHVFKQKNRTEWIAMVSDLFAAVVFGTLFVTNLCSAKGL